MSGAKRRTKYRKSLTDDILYGTPELGENQRIVVLQKTQGSNLMLVETAEGSTGLALLPTKFRKLVWIKRGDYLIVSEAGGDVTTASGSDGKVRYIVETVLYADQIKHLKMENKWDDALDAVSLRIKTGGVDPGSISKSNRPSSASSNSSYSSSDSDSTDSSDSSDSDDSVALPTKGFGHLNLRKSMPIPGSLPPVDSDSD